MSDAGVGRGLARCRGSAGCSCTLEDSSEGLLFVRVMRSSELRVSVRLQREIPNQFGYLFVRTYTHERGVAERNATRTSHTCVTTYLIFGKQYARYRASGSDGACPASATSGGENRLDEPRNSRRVDYRHDEYVNTCGPERGREQEGRMNDGDSTEKSSGCLMLAFAVIAVLIGADQD
ncbi:hypothetical protein EI94DRAFT_1703039 [Lactarius quietus]|nr:hypothetical protein EI94DRAFT_1703039 [Lactarius quietus]